MNRFYLSYNSGLVAYRNIYEGFSSTFKNFSGEMDAFEQVLGDAMNGDATLFARQDYVEEAWRIVDPVLKANTPVYKYEPE
jgi:glucose-6-phosphate 1-dehydrogenase